MESATSTKGLSINQGSALLLLGIHMCIALIHTYILTRFLIRRGIYRSRANMHRLQAFSGQVIERTPVSAAAPSDSVSIISLCIHSASLPIFLRKSQRKRQSSRHLEKQEHKIDYPMQNHFMFRYKSY